MTRTRGRYSAGIAPRSLFSPDFGANLEPQIDQTTEYVEKRPSTMMTNENDRKDENQPQKRVGGVREARWWALALFVSTIIPVVSTQFLRLGPFWSFGVIIYYGIPASVMGFILGWTFSLPRLSNSAMGLILGRVILVILCLVLMSYLFRVDQFHPFWWRAPCTYAYPLHNYRYSCVPTGILWDRRVTPIPTVTSPTELP